MTPQDFRVGNIFHRKHGKGWTETEITPEIMGKIFTDNDPEYAINDFEPIELSEEWLKKAGFTYYRIDGKASLNDDTDQNTGETEYWENKYFTIVRWDKGDFTLSNAFSFNLRPVLKYVHQLQNVVHALTGNELIFNHG